jgi:hypothetical protein
MAASVPLNARPIGLRAVATMTASGMELPPVESYIHCTTTNFTDLSHQWLRLDPWVKWAT